MDQGLSLNTLPLKELRDLIRNNQFTGSTTGCAAGYLQANLVILPAEWATDFCCFVKKSGGVSFN